MRRPSLTFFFGLAVLCLLTPNSARAQWGAGQCLVPGLSPAAVIELCEDALTIDPTHPEVLYKIGWAGKGRDVLCWGNRLGTPGRDMRRIPEKGRAGSGRGTSQV